MLYGGLPVPFPWQRSDRIRGLVDRSTKDNSMCNSCAVSQGFVWRANREKDGSVWESNPQRTFFKPPTGFEDQGHHQMCKHFHVEVFAGKSRCMRHLRIVARPKVPGYSRSKARSLGKR